MEIPEVANNHPQRVYVLRTFFWAGHSDWKGTPPVAAQKNWENNHSNNTGEQQVILGSWSLKNNSTQRINPSLMQICWNKLRQPFLMLKAPSSRQPSQTLLQNEIFYLLLFNLTLLYSDSTSQYYKQPTLHTTTKRPVSVPSQSPPLHH